VPALEPVESLDPLSLLEPSSSHTLEPLVICELSDCDEPVLDDDGYEEVDDDEAAVDFFALAFVPSELELPSAGSCPVTSVPKITAQVAMNSATVSATALRRMRRARERLAAKRGWMAAADMANTVRAHPKRSLSRP
jgi:hypothetical protein